MITRRRKLLAMTGAVIAVTASVAAVAFGMSGSQQPTTTIDEAGPALHGATASFAVLERPLGPGDRVSVELPSSVMDVVAIDEARKATSTQDATVWIAPSRIEPEAICIIGVRKPEPIVVVNCPSRAYAAAGKVLLPLPGAAGPTVQIGIAPDGIESVEAERIVAEVSGNAFVLPQSPLEKLVYAADNGSETTVHLSLR